MNQAEFDAYIKSKNNEIKELQESVAKFLKQLPQALAQERLLLLHKSIVTLQNLHQQECQDALSLYRQVVARINNVRALTLEQKKEEIESAESRLKQSLKVADDFFAGQIAERKKDIIALKIKYQL